MVGIFTSILAAVTACQSFSSPKVRVDGPLPPVSCVCAGGEWRAIDRCANTSRVPRQESVKIEAPPAASTIKVRSTQVADPMTAESIDLFCDFANWRPASFHFTDSSLLEVERGELERASQVLDDPHCTRHAAASRTQTYASLALPISRAARPPAV